MPLMCSPAPNGAVLVPESQGHTPGLGTLLPVLSQGVSDSRVIASDHIILILWPASNTEYNLTEKLKSSNLDNTRNQAWKGMGK